VRVHLVPDSGQESIEWTIPFSYFRLLAAFIVVGVLAFLFLIFSSGSLILERQQRRILERRLDAMTTRVARVHSLETQLEETTLVLLKVQEMLGVREAQPDSLLQARAAQEALSGEALTRLKTDLAGEGAQLLHASPSTWPVHGWVTREFSGKRGDEYHPGIDIAAPLGSPIRAAGDGIVLVAGWNDEYGNFVLLEHGFGVTSLYGHNSSLSVRKEDRVHAGDVIAYLGDTGRSTGPHLHFEVRRNGVPVDPRSFLLD
jgi:murein DD-endopeptidase MepM/ murein hydrolase activator NlpD